MLSIQLVISVPEYLQLWRVMEDKVSEVPFAIMTDILTWYLSSLLVQAVSTRFTTSFLSLTTSQAILALVSRHRPNPGCSWYVIPVPLRIKVTLIWACSWHAVVRRLLLHWIREPSQPTVSSLRASTSRARH